MFIKNFLCSVAQRNDAINVEQVFRSFSLFQCMFTSINCKKVGTCLQPWDNPYEVYFSQSVYVSGGYSNANATQVHNLALCNVEPH